MTIGKAPAQFVGILALSAVIFIGTREGRRPSPPPLPLAAVLKSLKVGMGLEGTRRLLSSYERLGAEQEGDRIDEVYEPGRASGQILDVVYMGQETGQWRLIKWSTRSKLGRIPEERTPERARATLGAQERESLNVLQWNLRYGMTEREAEIVLSPCGKFLSGGFGDLSHQSWCYYDQERNEVLTLHFKIVRGALRLTQWDWGQAPLMVITH